MSMSRKQREKDQLALESEIRKELTVERAIRELDLIEALKRRNITISLNDLRTALKRMTGVRCPLSRPHGMSFWSLDGRYIS